MIGSALLVDYAAELPAADGAFNNVSFQQTPSATITSSSFDAVTAAHPSRAIHLGMRLEF